MLHTLAAIHVEQRNFMHIGRDCLLHGVQQGLRGNCLVHQYGQIAPHRQGFGDLRSYAALSPASAHRVRLQTTRRPAAMSYCCCQCGCSSPIQPTACPSSKNLRGTPRMQGRMGCRNKTQQLRREQGFNIRFHIVKIDQLRGCSPLFWLSGCHRPNRITTGFAHIRCSLWQNTRRPRTNAPAPACGSG